MQTGRLRWRPEKWSLKDVLCHIMLWDKYFYVEALVKIKEGLPLTAAHMDFNAFNANAVLYARTVTRQEAIRLFVLYRTKIIEVAASLSDTALEQNHRDGDGKKIQHLQVSERFHLTRQASQEADREVCSSGCGH
ncbi:hypothetical protein ACFTAO_11210 [Paenibacillus rhizoplanae]